MAVAIHAPETRIWVQSPTKSFSQTPESGIVRKGTDTTSSESSDDSNVSQDERLKSRYTWSRNASYGVVSSIATGTSSVKRVNANHEEPYGDAGRCWDEKVLLSLDGGGIRGYASLLIMKRIMEEIARQEYNIDCTLASTERPRDSLESDDNKSSPPSNYERGFLPCHYFDYTCGTSVGGILATLLGRLRLSVPDAIKYYRIGWEKMAGRINQVDRILPPNALRSRCTKGMREALEQILNEQSKTRVDRGQATLIDTAGTFTQPSPELCRTVVLAVQYDDKTSTQRPYLFRSYSFTSEKATTLNRNIESHSDNVTFKDVCMATSAAPRYFKRHKIGDKKYRDGAIWMSDPSMELYREVSSVNALVNRPIYCLVSIGCGSQKKGFAETALRAFSPSRVKRRDSLHARERRLLDTVLQPDQRGPKKPDYFRFEGPEDLNEVHISEWRSEKSRLRVCNDIERMTERYCTPQMTQEIERLARLLVDYRRQRAQTTLWENYVYIDHTEVQSRHRCPFCSKEFERDPFVTHIKMQHPEEESKANGNFWRLLEANRIPQRGK